MREIKFRVWVPEQKIMGKPFNLEWYKRGIEKPEDWKDVGLSVSDGNGYWDDNAIFMQFTGLLDKNGKEIYEGDLIKVLDRDWSDIEKDTVIAEVCFKDGEYLLNKRAGGRYCSPKLYREYGRDRFEVIGNIYESKHLLDNTDTKV